MNFRAFFIFLMIILAIPLISEVGAHSLFNSAEEFIGGYRVQVATLPEFPQIGEKSQILIRVTDGDFNEVERFTMGIRIFFNDQQIDAYLPQSIDSSHWETDFIFENPGNHIFKIDLYDMSGAQGVLTYTFNMSTQSPFGYVFIVAITIGAITMFVVIGFIYLPKIIKRVKF